MKDNPDGPRAFRLILGLGGRRVATEVAAGTEVLPCPPWVGMPGLKPWLRGVAVYQSGLLPVVDLSCLLDARPLSAEGDGNRVVSVSAGGVRTGFLVASVSQADPGGDAGEAQNADLETLRLEELCLNLLADPQAAVEHP